MSGYHGRTGPNFSQFLNSLNTIQPSYENDILPPEDLNLDQELAIFTNADFTEFDPLNGLHDNTEINFDMNHEQTQGVDDGTELKFEELLAGEPNSYMHNYGGAMQPQNQQHAHHHHHHHQPQQQQHPYPPPSTVVSPSDSSSPQPGSSKAGMKRKSDAAPLSIEEQTRLAAEEDKRRRNTAASARFRIKKKQREQALEKTVKEINDKNAQLQAKLDQLEMENKWLKNLITEKNGNQGEKEIADLYQKFRRESEERESKGSDHKDGVGTQ